MCPLIQRVCFNREHSPLVHNTVHRGGWLHAITPRCTALELDNSTRWIDTDVGNFSSHSSWII